MNKVVSYGDEEVQLNDPEEIEVELTESQKEAADWLVGCPSMRLWFKEDHESGEDFSYLEEPELDGNTLKLEIDGFLLDNIVDELERLIDMIDERVAEHTPQQRAGAKRATNNLLDKIMDSCSKETRWDRRRIEDLFVGYSG